LEAFAYRTKRKAVFFPENGIFLKRKQAAGRIQDIRPLE